MSFVCPAWILNRMPRLFLIGLFAGLGFAYDHRGTEPIHSSY